VAIVKRCAVDGSTDMCEEFDISHPLWTCLAMALFIIIIKVLTIKAPVVKDYFKLVKHWA
jgi:hypothetical protein